MLKRFKSMFTSSSSSKTDPSSNSKDTKKSSSQDKKEDSTKELKPSASVTQNQGSALNAARNAGSNTTDTKPEKKAESEESEILTLEDISGNVETDIVVSSMPMSSKNNVRQEHGKSPTNEAMILKPLPLIISENTRVSRVSKTKARSSENFDGALNLVSLIPGELQSLPNSFDPGSEDDTSSIPSSASTRYSPSHTRLENSPVSVALSASNLKATSRRGSRAVEPLEGPAPLNLNEAPHIDKKTLGEIRDSLNEHLLHHKGKAGGKGALKKNYPSFYEMNGEQGAASSSSAAPQTSEEGTFVQELGLPRGAGSFLEFEAQKKGNKSDEGDQASPLPLIIPRKSALKSKQSVKDPNRRIAFKDSPQDSLSSKDSRDSTKSSNSSNQDSLSSSSSSQNSSLEDIRVTLYNNGNILDNPAGHQGTVLFMMQNTQRENQNANGVVTKAVSRQRTVFS